MNGPGPGQLAAAEQRGRVADQLHEPEVEQLGLLPRADAGGARDLDQHHVVGLEIAVRDAVRVRVCEHGKNLASDHERTARRAGNQAAIIAVVNSTAITTE